MSVLRYIPVVPVLVVCGVAVLVAGAVFILVVRRPDLRRAVVVTSRVLLACAVLAVLALTLIGGYDGALYFNAVPGSGIARQLRNVNSGLGLVNIVGNIVLFLPIGALLVLASSMGARRATLIGASMSLAVEVTQLAFGRSADIDDVLLNTLGAAIGAALAALIAKRFAVTA